MAYLNIKSFGWPQLYAVPTLSRIKIHYLYYMKSKQPQKNANTAAFIFQQGKPCTKL
jgi:hypothetical protein